MAFTTTQTLEVAKNYSGLSIQASSSLESVSVTYTILGIMELTAGSGTAEYSASIGGVSGPTKLFLFTYSGSGNPFDEAESQLEESINGG